MKFKVGDRVKFLNESGGGIISKIISHGLVNVSIEDGFEIPTMVSNLILAEAEVIPDARDKSPAPLPKREADSTGQEEAPERSSPLLSISGQKSLSPGLYFAFVPVNQRWLLTGSVDIFLMNHTPWDVMFSLLQELPDGSFRSRDLDIIPRNHRYHLTRVKPDHIMKWSKGTVQFLFRRTKLSKVMMPASVNFRISQQRFLAESNYLEYTHIEGRSFIVSLMPMPQQAEASEVTEGKDPAATTLKAVPVVPVEIIETYRIRDEIAVVDLHIESLTEDHESMKSHEILALQKSTFKACLESAIRSGYHSLTFIHGMGAGRLKQEIINILEGYRHIRVQDAPHSEYGQGALELIIPRNTEDQE